MAYLQTGDRKQARRILQQLARENEGKEIARRAKEVLGRM